MGTIGAAVGQIAVANLPHLLLDEFQVFRSEGRLALEIVVKARFDCRSDAELGSRIQLQHGRGQQVRSRMAVNLQGLFAVSRREDLQRRVSFERPGEVPQLAVERATTASSASRAPIERATSSGEAPAKTSLRLPSGNVIKYELLIIRALISAYHARFRRRPCAHGCYSDRRSPYSCRRRKRISGRRAFSRLPRPSSWNGPARAIQPPSASG